MKFSFATLSVKNLFLIISLSIAFSFLCACGKGKKIVDHKDADALFGKCEFILRNYNDSISFASDSLEVYRMIKQLDDDLAKVNYEFPPETDLKLNDEQNDSLIKLANKISLAKDEAFKRIRDRHLKDTVANQDTIIIF